jgi:hypothetical protein
VQWNCAGCDRDGLAEPQRFVLINRAVYADGTLVQTLRPAAGR